MKTIRLSGLAARILAVVAALAVVAVVAVGAMAASFSGCYGPHTVTYIDSARQAGGKAFDHDFDDGRLPYEKCGPAGVARIETYSGWFDMLVSVLLFSDADRSADFICAKEP